MSKHLIRVLVLGLGLASILAASGLVQAKVVEVGNLVITDNGGIAPSKLPKHRQAPISAFFDAAIRTKDGAHPPAARQLVIDFDRTIQVNAKGLPVCPKQELEARSTTAAKRACPEAVVGAGRASVEVEFPEQKPFTATGPLILFNGGVHGGKTLLFVHAYVSIPTPTAVVATVTMTRTRHGRYGLHTVTQIPRIAGGDGSLTKAKLKIDRNFAHRGQRQSYLTASCPTGHYFVEGEVLFSDETSVHLSHTFSCTPMR